MPNFKHNPKIIFIPGWLDSGELHGYQYNLDIWHRKVDLEQNFHPDYLIAHSIGSLAALYNWYKYQNFKIILINPVLSSKNIILRWWKSMTTEGTFYNLKRLLIFLSFIIATLKAKKLFKIPALGIINKIPLSDITIIYGTKDVYLCDRQIINQLETKGIKTIEVLNSGHNYDANLEKEIKSYLKVYSL